MGDVQLQISTIMIYAHLGALAILILLIFLLIKLLQKEGKDEFKKPLAFIGIGSVVFVTLEFLVNFDYLSIKADLLVEAHGLLYDIVVFGVIFGIYEIVDARTTEKKKLTDELDSIRGWHGDEAAFKVKYLIKNLLAKSTKVESIEFQDLHLGQMDSNILAHVISVKKKITCLRDGKFNNIDFSNGLLAGSDMRNISLHNCTLNGVKIENVDISGSTFVDSSFIGIDLTQAKYNKLKFINSHVSTYFNDTSLTLLDCTVDRSRFHNVIFEGSRFGKSYFGNCSFSNCNFEFEESGWEGVEFEKVSFQGCKIFMHEKRVFLRVSFSGCNFSTSYLVYSSFATLNMPNSTFEDCQLSAVNFSRAKLQHSSFSSAKRYGVDLNETNFTGSDLTGCRFAHASSTDLVNFSSSILVNVDFTQTTLSRSIFSMANLKNCDFTESTMYECDFSNCVNVKEVKSWKEAVFTRSKFSKSEEPYLRSVLQPEQLEGIDWVA